MVDRCPDCGIEFRTLGWDDMPAEARTVLLASLAEDKDNETD